MTHPQPADPSFRPALAGIRAVAVLAVVAYHLGVPGFTGGFLGVDIFFVLSGYLITSLLLREHAKFGRINFSQFYIRRARRLLPAVLLLLVVVAIVGVSYDPVARVVWRDDSIATLLYFANWHFIAADASYFADFIDPSPLRHMWSLAIEEQFYVFWPLLLVVILGRRGVAAGRRVLWLAVVLAATSAVGMALLFSQDPSRAYYGTDTRVHQLFIGVITAVILFKWKGQNTKQRSVAASAFVLLASCGLAWALHTVSGESSLYYRGGAIGAALLTALLIIGVEFRHASSPERSPVYWFLSTRPMVWIGGISYGLYIWHWPIQIWIADDYRGLNPSQVAAVRFVLSLAAATASFYLVEQPIRRGALATRVFSRRWSISVIPLVLVVAAVGIVRATPVTPAAEWATDIQPGTFRVLGDTDPRAPTLAVVGDSIAKSLLPALGDEGRRRGVRIIAAAWSGCGIAIGRQTLPDGSEYSFSDACRKAVPSAYRKLVETYHPDVVWGHSVREIQWQVAPDGSLLKPGTAAHDRSLIRGYQSAYTILASQGAVVQLAPPTFKAARHKGMCRAQTAIARPGCAADDGRDGIYPHLQQVIAQFIETRTPRVVPVGTSPIVCPEGPPCPDFLPGHPGIYLRWDGSHFTAKGAQLVAPLLLEAIAEASQGRLTLKAPAPSAEHSSSRGAASEPPSDHDISGSTSATPSNVHPGPTSPDGSLQPEPSPSKSSFTTPTRLPTASAHLSASTSP